MDIKLYNVSSPTNHGPRFGLGRFWGCQNEVAELTDAEAAELRAVNCFVTVSDMGPAEKQDWLSKAASAARREANEAAEVAKQKETVAASLEARLAEPVQKKRA